MPFLWFGCLPWARVFKSWSQPVVSLGAEEPLSGEVYGEEVRSLGAGPQRGTVGLQSFLMLLLPTAPTVHPSHAVLPCHKPTLLTHTHTHTQGKVPTVMQFLPHPPAPNYRYTQHQWPWKGHLHTPWQALKSK